MAQDRVGMHTPLSPQDPNSETTVVVKGGALCVGVEPRLVDAATLKDLYAGTDQEQYYTENADPDLSLTGISLHVCDAATGHEYLRFDCFEDEPHYHYMHPGPDGKSQDNHVIWYDDVAHGPMLPWALGQLKGRLPEMLEEAGGGHLVPILDPETLGATIQDVAEIAYAALEQQKAMVSD